MASTHGQLLARDEIVSELRHSLSSTEHGLGTVPNAIKVVIRDKMWQERVLRQTGERVAFSSFAEFVTRPPLEGLGATLSQLRGVCRDDPEALDYIEQATTQKPGRRPSTTDNVSNKREAEQGNSTSQALRRLRKDRPDLHAAVLAGGKSPHAAMIEAGFRPKTVTIPLTVDGATRLMLRLSDDERDEVIARVLKAAS